MQNVTMSDDPAIDSEHLLKKRYSESVPNCHESSIMTNLIYDASPFLFPCTIEYSLICAVILYEMWVCLTRISTRDQYFRFVNK